MIGTRAVLDITYSTKDDGLNEVYDPDDDEAKAGVDDASDEIQAATKSLHFRHLLSL